MWSRPAPEEPRPVERYRLGALDVGEALVVANPTLSGDGRRLLFVGYSRSADQRGLFQRPLDALSASPVEGTERAGWATYSPDGTRIAFYDAWERNIKRISVHGGQASVLFDPGYVPFHWAQDGFIYITRRGGGEEPPGLWRMRPEGGEPEELTRAVRDADTGRFESHAAPHLLPGGRAVVFAVGRGYANSGWDLALLDLPTGEWRRIVEHGVQPLYLSPGFLLFTRDDRVWAAPFNAEALEVGGEPRPVIEDVQMHQTAPLQVAQFGVSDEGSLVYVRGERSGERHGRLSLVGSGREPEVLIESEVSFLVRPALSPDGRRVALARLQGTGRAQVWILERGDGSWSRATAESNSWAPAWTADGQGLAYVATRGQSFVILRKAFDSGVEEVLFTDETELNPIAFLPDGRSLLFWRATGRGDILLLDPEGGVRPVMATEATETVAHLSPDGRWLAYESDVTGQWEVHLLSFPPEGRAPRLVSLNGGRAPRWAPEGLRLFYREGYPGAGRILAVDISPDRGLPLSTPVTVVETPAIGSGAHRAYSFFDVARDGRVVLAERLSGLEPNELVVVRNWVRELEELFSDAPRSR
jgi:serine/threonine-protein kinase